jgi:hypothetical protein
MSEIVVDVDRDLNEFNRFIDLRLFRLKFYKTFEDGKPVYCIGLLVRCEDPGGWVAVWKRCYGDPEVARKLFDAIELKVRNRLAGLLLIEVDLLSSDMRDVVSD